MHVLGISAYYHDSAACLIRDGVIVAAAQEERFSRIKHDAAFPEQAVQWCLRHAGIDFDQVDHVGFYEKPYLKLHRILGVAGRFFPHGFEAFDHAMSAWLNSKIWIPGAISQALLSFSPSEGRNCRWDRSIHFSEHHQAHAASAFFPSPFEEADVLVMDGVGEWSTTSLSRGYLDRVGVPRIEFLKEIRYPDSLGMLYSAFTSFLGFKVNSGEYKVMGLAPYGKPVYAGTIRDQLIELRPDGSFRLNFEYFSFPYDYRMTTARFADLIGLSPRQPEAPLERVHFDIAASLQLVLEDAVLAIARHLHAISGSDRLCLAGGVALNCVANGRVLREGPYADVWVQPAATDSGGALGVALYIWHEVLKQRRAKSLAAVQRVGRDIMKGALLGPEFSNAEIEDVLERRGIAFQRIDPKDYCDTVARLLASGNVVGWFQGRMEFGPRALGSRSILADPRSPDMQRTLNLKIKYRESFRPFAPAVLREKAAEWFDLDGREGSLLGAPGAGYDSPYMLLVAPIAQHRRSPLPDGYEALVGLEKLNTPRSDIPSCTHVDYSARVQTVCQEDHPRFRALISAFESLTGVPILVNTSFNVRGEPIVCTPEDAIKCFLGTEMDVLAIGDILVHKSTVPEEAKLDYKASFAPD
ncbi:MAG: carbamoyltransferase [Hyphomicrobiaceae bacterium]